MIPAMSIPLLEGWGNYRMPVTASNDSSEFILSKGINMYYGFHSGNTLASFDKSTVARCNGLLGMAVLRTEH